MSCFTTTTVGSEKFKFLWIAETVTIFLEQIFVIWTSISIKLVQELDKMPVKIIKSCKNFLSYSRGGGDTFI